MPRALALLVAAVLVAPASAAAEDITVYSSLPLIGPLKAQSLDTVRGEQLALEQAGSRAGVFGVRFVSLDDATRRDHGWSPERVAANARRVVSDDSAIAYLGEFNSAASGISMPILNESGILQVSPGNSYVGLTRREGGEPGEPDKYIPSGTRTYGRVVPADHLQAAALAALMRDEGVKRVFIVDDLQAYGDGLARMVRRRAAARGIRIAGRRHLRARNAAAIARAIRRSHADAMFFGGTAETGALRLWRAVHRRNPKLALFAPEGVTDRAFYADLGSGAARRTLITNPTLSPAAYPAAAQAFFAAFRARFGHEPQIYGLYGYEAMSVVLDAIRRAGSRDRAAVIRAFFATRDRDSVLGRYSIDRNGDTTLSTYGVLKISRKRLVFDRTIDSRR
jgi:branched-chain amino acid transport system substrate-binding protein